MWQLSPWQIQQAETETVDTAKLEEEKEIKGYFTSKPVRIKRVEKIEKEWKSLFHPSYNQHKTVVFNKYWLINLSSDRKQKSLATGSVFSRTEGLF